MSLEASFQPKPFYDYDVKTTYWEWFLLPAIAELCLDIAQEGPSWQI